MKRRNDVIDALTNKLFEPEFNRLEKQRINIVNENRILTRNTDSNGFYYQGQLYTDLSNSIGYSKGNRTKLHPSLVPTIQAYLDDSKNITFDYQRVKQALSILLKDVRSLQDLRDALPNQLVDLIDTIKHLERTRPEAFTIQDNKQKYEQYMKLKDKIEFYSATRLIY